MRKFLLSIFGLAVLSIDGFAATDQQLLQYLGWMRPSFADELVVVENDGTRLHAEWLGYSFNDNEFVYRGIHYGGAQDYNDSDISLKSFYDGSTAGTYGGRLGVFIREYIQPGGIPGYKYMLIKDKSSVGGQIRINNGVIGYSVPATLSNSIQLIGQDTDENDHQFFLWFYTLPDLSGNTQTVQVEHCAVSQAFLDGRLCVEARLRIQGVQ